MGGGGGVCVRGGCVCVCVCVMCGGIFMVYLSRCKEIESV